MHPFEKWFVRGTKLVVVCCLDDVYADFAPDRLDLEALFEVHIKLMESCAIEQLTKWCGGADRPLQQAGLTGLRLAKHEQVQTHFLCIPVKQAIVGEQILDCWRLLLLRYRYERAGALVPVVLVHLLEADSAIAQELWRLLRGLRLLRLVYRQRAGFIRGARKELVRRRQPKRLFLVLCILAEERRARREKALSHRRVFICFWVRIFYKKRRFDLIVLGFRRSFRLSDDLKF